MDIEYFLPFLNIRRAYVNEPLKPSRPEQCRVDHVGTVCCRNHYNVLELFKPVDLCKDLADHSFCHAGVKCYSSCRYHRIYFIKKYDRGCSLPCLPECFPDRLLRFPDI